MDLNYGRYERDKEPELKLKLIIGVVESIIEKDAIKPIEKIDDEEIKEKVKKYFLHIFKSTKKRKEDLLFNDSLSQSISASQSSRSSSSSTITEQKSVRNFKERIREQQHPFFVRCFIQLGILIFLFVLAASGIFCC